MQGVEEPYLAGQQPKCFQFQSCRRCCVWLYILACMFFVVWFLFRPLPLSFGLDLLTFAAFRRMGMHGEYYYLSSLVPCLRFYHRVEDLVCLPGENIGSVRSSISDQPVGMYVYPGVGDFEEDI